MVPLRPGSWKWAGRANKQRGCARAQHLHICILTRVEKNTHIQLYTNTKRCTCDVDNTITPLGGSWRKDGFCLICGDRDPGNISEGQVVGIVLMSQLWCGTMGRKVWTCVLWMCFQCRFKNPHKGLMERTPYKIFFKELNHKKTSNTLKRKLQISTEKMDNSDSQKNIYIYKDLKINVASFQNCALLFSLTVLMCFSVIHHHIVVPTTAGQVSELPATVRLVEQINHLHHSWCTCCNTVVTHICHISKQHPSKWQDVHTYIHTLTVSCPSMSRGCWPSLSSTSCVPPTRVPRGRTLNQQKPSSLSLNLLSMSTSFIFISWYFLPHLNICLSSSHILAPWGKIWEIR